MGVSSPSQMVLASNRNERIQMNVRIVVGKALGQEVEQ